MNDPPADPPKSRFRVARPVVLVAALTAVALVGVGGIVAGYVIQRNEPPARVVLPVLPSAGASASSPVASASPPAGAAAIGGFTPAACSGPVPASAPRTPQKNAVRGTDASQLYPGWSYFTDGTFHLPVPDRWTYQKFGTTYCFRDPNGVRMMILDTNRKPTADPVTACRVEAKRVVNSGVLPGYQLVSIASRPLLEKAADWEYKYRGPDDTPMHVETRWEVVNGKAYAIAWVNDQADWSGDFAKFQMVLAIFLGGQ